MSWNIYLGWSSLALKPTIEYNFDPKIQGDEQNLQKQKAHNSAKTKLFWGIWGKFLSHFEDKQWTADCWPWSIYPYCWFCGGQWTWISKSKAIVWHAPKPVNRFRERPKSITFAHGCLCDPGSWSPLIFAYTVLYFYLHMYILYTSIFVYWTDYTVYIYLNIYIYMYTFHIYIYIYTYILYTNILYRFVDL